MCISQPNPELLHSIPTQNSFTSTTLQCCNELFLVQVLPKKKTNRKTLEKHRLNKIIWLIGYKRYNKVIGLCLRCFEDSSLIPMLISLSFLTNF